MRRQWSPNLPTSAIVFITVVSMIACWLNWGFGLVVGAILAKEIAKAVEGVDYRLLIRTQHIQAVIGTAVSFVQYRYSFAPYTYLIN